MPGALTPAIWRGPFVTQLPNGRTLAPGDECEVTDGDLLSDHWQAVAKNAAKAKREHNPDPANPTPGEPAQGSANTPADPPIDGGS